MDFIKGMDVSMARALEEHGASYFLEGKQEDLFRVLKRCGSNMVRLRLWVDPYDEYGCPYGGGNNDLQTTQILAQRAMDNGLDYMLDFHYSDFWADPAKQLKPKAWAGLALEELVDAVYRYTWDTLTYLKDRSLAPAMVQVGNEITNGLLWPEGHISQVEQMAALLSAGIQAVRQVCPEAKIVLHLDFGTDSQLYTSWFDRVAPYNLSFDIIGMSYYPHWNGSIEKLAENMDLVSQRYDKDVLVAETSIGYTTQTLGCTGLVFTRELEAQTGYPATPEGQVRFLEDIYAAVRGISNGRGLGVFYWEPAWLPIPTCTWANPNGRAYMNDIVEPGNSMANQALFDRHGNAGPALLGLRAM